MRDRRKIIEQAIRDYFIIWKFDDRPFVKLLLRQIPDLAHSIDLAQAKADSRKGEDSPGTGTSNIVARPARSGE